MYHFGIYHWYFSGMTKRLGGLLWQSIMLNFLSLGHFSVSTQCKKLQSGIRNWLKYRKGHLPIVSLTNLKPSLMVKLLWATERTFPRWPISAQRIPWKRSRHNFRSTPPLFPIWNVMVGTVWLRPAVVTGNLWKKEILLSNLFKKVNIFLFPFLVKGFLFI